MKKTCPNCEQEFEVELRRDQKFCAEDCRTDYNNRKKDRIFESLHQDLLKLKRNYRILWELFQEFEKEGEVWIPIIKVWPTGFDPEFPAHWVTGVTGEGKGFHCQHIGQFSFLLNEKWLWIKKIEDRHGTS